jgi:hypothetical protein
LGTRILHCGKSLKNYYLCINERVAGFIQRGQQKGDTVYLAVKINNDSFCGARATLTEQTDFKPWEDAERYTSIFKIDNIEYCEPYDLRILEKIGGKYWVLKYVQASKTILNEEVVFLLNEEFNKHIRDSVYEFENSNEDETEGSFEEEEEENSDDVTIEEVPEAKIKVMATFQTINFKNESDKFRGMETLVNENFFELFPQYPEGNSLLIPENRLFVTKGLDNEKTKYSGIRGIPDAILLTYENNKKIPIQINLIEYECYGESKIRSQDKSNYLNGHIIPQLMRFASTFSIVTEKQIRELTIKDWTKKIVGYIYNDKNLQALITSWVKEIHPEINDQLVGLTIQEYLEKSLRYNLKIILVIDGLTVEQKDTLNNIIKAFKLENDTSIQFVPYVIRLEQKIVEKDSDSEFAISVQ